MHSANNMVGVLVTSAYDVPLWKRYFRISKHSKVGFLRKAMVAVAASFEMKVGVVLYG